MKLHKQNLKKSAPERIMTQPEHGLTSEQAEERIAAGYVNTPAEAPVKSVRQIIAGNIFTYFNMIFFVLALLLISVGSYNDLMFLGVIISNAGIGIIQELNAKRTLDRLTLLSAPHSTVIRDGKRQTVSSESTVVDDIIIFTAGDQICADGTVITGEIQVNESLITGESDEITKHAGDLLLSGSFAVSGECCARLDKVGADSFVSRLTLEAKRAGKAYQKGMMASLTKLIKVIGIAIIPLGILTYLKEINSLTATHKEAVESMSAALIGMIPEGLYLLTTIALAVSVVRLAQKKTLVHDLKCIETLARADVLCVDKTGTVTTDEMTVEDIIPFADFAFTGEDRKAEAKRLIGRFAYSMNADNATMKAIKAEFEAEYTDEKPPEASKVIAFNSKYKYSGAEFGGSGSYVLGAPEFILQSGYKKYEKLIGQHTVSGLRVLIMAEYGGRLEGGALTESVSPIAMILLSNEIRPEAAAAFEYFAKQNVEIKVISGDNPYTAGNAAGRAGIPNSDKVTDAALFGTPEETASAADKYTVFGRVTPEQKRDIIRALKEKGKTVAMTGDGVNDVLALKEADCSIAMASGSDAACRAANLVLLDSNFASMPAVVAEGRRVINNIERSASLFLVKNIFSFVLTLVSLFAAFSYPVSPSQLSLVSTMTIGLPSFILALQPDTSIVRGKFMRNVLLRALPAGLTDIITVSGILIFAENSHFIPDTELSTVVALTMGVIGIIMLFRVCMPFNRLRVITWSGVCIIFTLAARILAPLFKLVPLSGSSWIVLGVSSAAGLILMVLLSRIMDKLQKSRS